MKKGIRIIAPVLVILALVISAFAMATPAMADVEEAGGASVVITMSRTPASQYRDGTVRYTVTIRNDENVDGATNAWVDVTFRPPAANGTATGPLVVLATNRYIEVGESFVFDYITNPELEVSLSHIDEGVTIARAQSDVYAIYDDEPQYDGGGNQNVPVTVLDFAELGDFVWHDLNRDGIQDPGEPGIEGVTVNLWSANATTCDPIAIIDTTTTNATGYYLFDGLRAGNYRVQFVLPEGDWAFTDAFAGANTAIDSNADPATGISDCVTLAAGDSNLTIDAGMYGSAYRICGFKYLAGTTQGLSGWEIILEKWVVGAGWVEEDPRATTDGSGKYCFEDLTIGDYRVSETPKAGWTQISPIPNEHIVTLPEGTSDPSTGPFYDFKNQPPPVGGDAYPVSRQALLAPWVALALVVFGVAGLLLRRGRAV